MLLNGIDDAGALAVVGDMWWYVQGNNLHSLQCFLHVCVSVFDEMFRVWNSLLLQCFEHLVVTIDQKSTAPWNCCCWAALCGAVVKVSATGSPDHCTSGTKSH